MIYPEIAPEELLAEGFDAPRITEQPWLVRWDEVDGDIAEVVLKNLPPTVEFHTSGSTGPSRSWSRTREYLWAEAGMLAGLLRPQRPEAVMAFVHPSHLYGALSSVLVPAQLGVPVWYRPSFAGMMPPKEHSRWVVTAIPWIFSLLRRNIDWVRQMDQISVLHASGMVPSAAGYFLEEAEGRAQVVEVFGSTESGGVATRNWSSGEPPPWELFSDVSFARPPSEEDGTLGVEVPLAVRSPRIAFQEDGKPPRSWELDDYVEMLDDRRFRFTGRRSRLVNVNGRRLHLDELEDALRSILDCADLALRPVADDMIGEHVELLVVLKPGTTLADLDLNAAIDRLTVRPRQVHVVDRIDRTEIGKLRRVQESVTTDAGADT
ncbi:class I adenylate-forming enzyme family protein [Amycolatopsis anabasis]|uniref:class I adenylate-forming enzyme family protein n=1 Tax=Amycolatopsis anabasis TaxID=1840409 RepID=UPI00131E0266|nr:class I adenylate-forming enzyme family protein [Amycolatopsis anabasis]